MLNREKKRNILLLIQNNVKNQLIKSFIIELIKDNHMRIQYPINRK